MASLLWFNKLIFSPAADLISVNGSIVPPLRVKSLIQIHSCTDLTLFCSRLSYLHLRLQIHTQALGFLRSAVCLCVCPVLAGAKRQQWIWLFYLSPQASYHQRTNSSPPLLHLLFKQSQSRMLTRTGSHFSLLFWQKWDSFTALALSTF